ncbi:chitin-binding domain protein cbd-1-like, partial [Argonauta hians]
ESSSTMRCLITAVVVVVVFSAVCGGQAAEDSHVGVDCSHKKDGYYEISCKSFVECNGGKKHTFYCKGITVLDKSDMKCKNPDKVPKPCGQVIDCSKKKDGRYPDMDTKCKSYFTCDHGQYLGHNFCPPGLVFYQKLQLCDWPYNVPPPCGTKK